MKDLEHGDDWVRSVCFSGDGAYVASGGDDGRVKVWDASSGACVKDLEHGGGYVMSVCFSGDGAYVASGGSDGRVKVWDASSGACVKDLEHGGYHVWVTSVCFSPDGAQLASYDKMDSKQWKVWDVATGAPVVPAPADASSWQDAGAATTAAFAVAVDDAATVFAVAVDDAATVTVRRAGAADGEGDVQRFSPAESVVAKEGGCRVNRDGNVVVARGTMNAPPLILVPHGVDLHKD